MAIPSLPVSRVLQQAANRARPLAQDVQAAGLKSNPLVTTVTEHTRDTKPPGLKLPYPLDSKANFDLHLAYLVLLPIGASIFTVVDWLGNLATRRKAGSSNGVIGGDYSNARLDHMKFIDKEAPFSHAKLTGASLRGVQAPNGNFFKADASLADFKGARLGGDLRGMKALSADFTEADMGRAVFDGRSDFGGATLRGARFSGSLPPNTGIEGKHMPDLRRASRFDLGVNKDGTITGYTIAGESFPSGKVRPDIQVKRVQSMLPGQVAKSQNIKVMISQLHDRGINIYKLQAAIDPSKDVLATPEQLREGEKLFARIVEKYPANVIQTLRDWEKMSINKRWSALKQIADIEKIPV